MVGPNAVHRFTRMVEYNLTNPTPLNPYIDVATFGLNALNNYAEFTNLFDQYKISFVKLYWELNYAPQAQAAATAVFPRLYWFNDFTDVTVPANLNVFRERSKTKVVMLRPGKPVVTTIRPAISYDLYRTIGGATVNAPKWNTWLRSETPDVQHLGQKYAIDNWIASPNYTITLRVKYWLQCKQVQ